MHCLCHESWRLHLSWHGAQILRHVSDIARTMTQLNLACRESQRTLYASLPLPSPCTKAHGPGMWGMEVPNISNADLEMIAGNCHMRAMLPQLCLIAHILCSLPEVLTHQQDHDIYQRLGAVLAEEVGTPVQYLLLQATVNICATLKSCASFEIVWHAQTNNWQQQSVVVACYVLPST